MKRLFSLLLFVALCMSAFPAAVLAIERDDYENIASKDYTEDETVFFTSYESLSLSSGSPDRWNAMYPRTQVGPIDNPTDPTDKVGCFLSPGSTATKKFLYA